MTRARCPICAAPAVPMRKGQDGSGELDPVFPFCSRRCQLVDLSHWIDGDYRVEEEPLEGYGGGSDSSSDGEV